MVANIFPVFQNINITQVGSTEEIRSYNLLIQSVAEGRRMIRNLTAEENSELSNSNSGRNGQTRSVNSRRPAQIIRSRRSISERDNSNQGRQVITSILTNSKFK